MYDRVNPKIAMGLRKLIKDELTESTKTKEKEIFMSRSQDNLNRIISELPSKEKTIMVNQPIMLHSPKGTIGMIGEEKFILCELGQRWHGDVFAEIISLDDVTACLNDISSSVQDIPRYRVNLPFLRSNFEGGDALLNKIHDAADNYQMQITQKERAEKESVEQIKMQSFDEDPIYGSW